MSKIEKMVQDAQAWRKKHAGEPVDFTKLDGALTRWHDNVNQISGAQAALKAAKATLGDTKKAVAAALKETKASRKKPKVAVKAEAKPAAKTKAKAKDAPQA